MSAVLESALSVAVSRSTYVPAAEKLAVVLSALTLPNVTVPGPLNLDHVTVSVLPAGRPSSAADTFRCGEAGCRFERVDVAERDGSRTTEPPPPHIDPTSLHHALPSSPPPQTHPNW